jgi:hypothetical protein
MAQSSFGKEQGATPAAKLSPFMHAPYATPINDVGLALIYNAPGSLSSPSSLSVLRPTRLQHTTPGTVLFSSPPLMQAPDDAPDDAPADTLTTTDAPPDDASISDEDASSYSMVVP